MLCFCRLASHKNNLIIYDFFGQWSSDKFFLHECVGRLYRGVRGVRGVSGVRDISGVRKYESREYSFAPLLASLPIQKSSRYDCSFLIGVQRVAIRRVPYL